MKHTKQEIVEYCNINKIRIRELPSGAVRLVSATVDMLYADWSLVSTKDLTTYIPPPKRQVREALIHG